MGAVGSAYDYALVEGFWGRMQVELFNRRKWKTRIELATAIHDYIELWHNPRRQHSALGMRTSNEAEAAWLHATRTTDVDGTRAAAIACRVAGAVARPSSHRTVLALFAHGSSGWRVVTPAAGRLSTLDFPRSGGHPG